MALNVEGVVDGSMNGEKSLGRSDTFEALYLAFSASGGLMGILRPVVSPSAGAMPMLDPKITRGGMVRSQTVCDEVFRREGIFLEELAH